jgi:hypothetical protein
MRLRSALCGDGQRHAEQRLARKNAKAAVRHGCVRTIREQLEEDSSIMVGSVCGLQTKSGSVVEPAAEKAERRCC